MVFHENIAVLLLGLFALPVAAHAQDNGLALPPEGTTIINFSATETRTVPQDLLIASLRIEVEEDTPVAIQTKINEAMKKALDLAKKESALKVSTGGYMVHKYDRPIGKRDPETGEQQFKSKWQGSQTIEIQSKDADKVLEVTGKIQALGFAMNNLQYTLHPDTVEKVREELLVEALKKLQNKAKIVGETLGKAKVDLVDVNVDIGGPVMPMYKNMMARAEMAMDAGAPMPTPVAAAGETDVALTVSARALIKP
jgi:uncharacterized protein YggE